MFLCFKGEDFGGEGARASLPQVGQPAHYAASAQASFLHRWQVSVRDPSSVSALAYLLQGQFVLMDVNVLAPLGFFKLKSKICHT